MFAFLSRAASAIRGVSGSAVVPGNVRSLPKRGSREMLAAYSASPMLQAVARKIAHGVASTPIWAAIKVDGQEQRVDGHLLETLLSSGVPGLDGFQCRSVMALHRLLVGEAFAVLDRNAFGAPVRRWPVPPHWVRETPVPGRDWFEITPEGGGNLRFPRQDVLWLKDVDPLNPYARGSGIAMSLDDELKADEYAAKHLAGSLANRARPDIVVSGTKEMPFNDTDRGRIEEVWTQRFTGPNRASLPFFSRGPINVHDLTPSFKELDLTNLRAYERDIIVTVFGVPPELVGILANSNRATIESAEFLFTKHVIRPRLEADCAAVTDQLAPQYDPALYASFDDPVDEDRSAVRAYMLSRPDVFDIDEHRAAAGLDPLPDGLGKKFPMSFGTVFADHGRPAPAPAPAQQLAAKHGLRRKNVGDVPDSIPDDWFTSTLEAAYRQTIEDFSRQALVDVGVEIAFDVFSPPVKEWLSTMAAERSRLIVGATRDALKVTLADGVEAGENSQKLVRRIQEVVADAGVSRANTIARTEIVQASNYATTEAHKAAGITQREWLATQDSNVRDEHVELDGKTVGIDEPFVVAGSRGMYPGGFGVAALDINCRCATLPKFEDEVTGAKRKSAWLKTEAGRAPHERALEVRLVAAFERLADRLAAEVEG